MIPDHKPIIWV